MVVRPVLEIDWMWMREENPSPGNGVGSVSPNKTGHLEGAEDFMSGTEESSSRVKAQDMYSKQQGPLQQFIWLVGPDQTKLSCLN